MAKEVKVIVEKEYSIKPENNNGYISGNSRIYKITI